MLIAPTEMFTLPPLEANRSPQLPQGLKRAAKSPPPPSACKGNWGLSFPRNGTGLSLFRTQAHGVFGRLGEYMLYPFIEGQAQVCFPRHMGCPGPRGGRYVPGPRAAEQSS